MKKSVILVVFILIGLLFTGCEPNPDAVYSVVYFGNGNMFGFAPSDPAEYKSGMEAVILGKGTLIRNGYTFICWNTKADGTGKSYEAGSIAKIVDRNIFLYAVWEKD